MVAFHSASDAVACAVAMQQAVQRQRRRVEETLAMRVGVAVGEATREESDYFGTPEIEASRLCGRAHSPRRGQGRSARSGYPITEARIDELASLVN